MDKIEGRSAPICHGPFGKCLVRQHPICDAMDIFGHVRTIRDGIEFPAIRSCVRIDGMRSHLIGADLRRLHEPVVDAQRGNAFFTPQRIGAVHDILLHGIHIIGRPRDLRL